jgi:hypothetical protein
MKKILYALAFSLLATGAAQAEVLSTNLSIAVTGTYSDATTVTTSLSYGTATFDVVYTLGAKSGGSNTFASSFSGLLGVGSDGDAHVTTLDGDADDGLSFTGLSIVNFVANDSGLVEGDITGLTFVSFDVASTSHAQDGANVSLTGFATDVANVNLSLVGSEDTIDLTALSNYSAVATNLYVGVDNISDRNRWSLTGLAVEYSVIPKPATMGMVGLGAILTLLIRKDERG